MHLCVAAFIIERIIDQDIFEVILALAAEANGSLSVSRN